MDLLRRMLQRDRSVVERQRNPQVRPGCVAIADAPYGRVVRISGDIASVILQPETNVRALEAEIDDGTGRLVVVWLGRDAIRGIEPGRGIIIEGRVVLLKDVRTMHNPKYELLPRGAAE